MGGAAIFITDRDNLATESHNSNKATKCAEWIRHPDAILQGSLLVLESLECAMIECLDRISKAFNGIFKDAFSWQPEFEDSEAEICFSEQWRYK